MCTTGLIRKYPLPPCPLQCGELQIGILVIGGDATIADLHSAILILIDDARKLLFLHGWKLATKILRSALGQDDERFGSSGFA